MALLEYASRRQSIVDPVQYRRDRNLKPTSIYQRAKLVEADFVNVKKDCETLEASGFIVLEDSGDNRGTKIPKLIFDYNVIEIHMTSMVYGHNLGKTAA